MVARMNADAALTSARNAFTRAMVEEQYSDARRHLLRAKAIISTLPSGGSGGSSMSWTMSDIKMLLREIETLEAMKNAADSAECGGFSTCPVEYTGVR